jgi:drug/metabolite transporter (DMT)-like permease
MGGLFALLAALGFTIDNILTRKGLMEENPGTIWDIRLVVSLTAMTFFLVGISTATLLGFNILQEFKQVSYLAILLLIVAGVLGPFLGAFLFSTAIAQIGASHASALWAGSNPLFVALLAMVFLGEIPDLIGIFSVLIIVGAFL